MTERAKGRAKGHWDDPISPLQAARFAKHETLEQAAEGISAVCPGHVRGGVRRDCEMRGGLLNDYERGARRPSVDHLQALCDYYRASAEDLGLVKVTWAGADGPHGAARPSGIAVGTIQTNTGYSSDHQASRSAAPSGDDGEAAPFAELLAAVLLEEGHGGDGSDEVERRLFLDRVIATVAGATAVDPVVRVARHVRERLLVTKVGDSDLDALDQAARRHMRAFPRYDLGESARNLAFDWARAGRMLELPQTPSQRVRLSAAYARLSAVLATLGQHAGNVQRSVEVLQSGQHAAREAGDSDLLAWLYGRQGLVIGLNGRDQRAAIDLYGQGLAATGSKTMTTAWLHAAIARSHAELGDRDAAIRELNKAEEVLGQASVGCWGETDDQMPRGFLFAPDRLAFYTGETLIRLSEDAAAARACAYATSLHDRLRVRSNSENPLNRLNLALATLRRGEADVAYDIATEAIRNYQGTDSLVGVRARAFGRALAAHGSTRQASDFVDFMRSARAG